ncbi:MAG: hypothetical protein ACREA0_30445, partial [bacterium]
GLSNAMLVSRSTLYLATFLVQFGFYTAALGGVWSEVRILRIPSFLLMTNLAILTAWFRYARGERITSWSPSQRMRALPQSTSREDSRVVRIPTPLAEENKTCS